MDARSAFRGKGFIIAAALIAVGGGFVWHFSRKRDEVDFSRDIRPIFNANCVACHGGVRQKNNVSFIFREEALGVGKSGRRTSFPAIQTPLN